MAVQVVGGAGRPAGGNGASNPNGAVGQAHDSCQQRDACQSIEVWGLQQGPPLSATLVKYRIAPESSTLMIQDAVLLHMVITVHCSRLSRADLDEDELNGAEYHDPGGEAKGNLAISSGVLGAGVTPEPVQTSPSCHTAPPEGFQSQLSEFSLL